MILDSLNLLWAALAAGLVRGMALFLFAAAITGLWKGLPSEARHLVWLSVIFSFLLLPLAWLALPTVALGPRIPVQAGTAFRLATAPALSRDAYAGLVDTTVQYAALTGHSPPFLLHWLSIGLPIVWLVGVLALAVRLAAGLRTVILAARRGRADARLQSAVDRLSVELSMSRRASVALSSRCSSPFTFGILRPVILLPEAARSWGESRARRALGHPQPVRRVRDLHPVLVLPADLGRLRRHGTGGGKKLRRRRGGGRDSQGGLCPGALEHRAFLPGACAAARSSHYVREEDHGRRKGQECARTEARRFGAWAAVRVLVICLCCIAPLLMLTAAAKPVVVSADDPVFGTWVNEEYDNSELYLMGRFVFFPDGRELDYRKIADQTPATEGMNVFEDSWIDAEGNHYYKVRSSGWIYPSRAGFWEGFSLWRVSASGTVFEGVFAQVGYPTEVSTLGSGYGIYYKR